jgi:hypothetical protein
MGIASKDQVMQNVSRDNKSRKITIAQRLPNGGEGIIVKMLDPGAMQIQIRN